MKKNSTYELCSNFGHNFYREKQSENNPDVIKCKHCEISIRMNGNGDFEETSKFNHAIHNAMKELFLLRNTRLRRLEQRV